MKFFSTLVSFGVVAAGLVANAASIPMKRDLEVSASVNLEVCIDVMTQLVADVKVVTGNINSTISGVTDSNKSECEKSVNSYVGDIISLVGHAVAEIDGQADVDVKVDVEVDISLDGLICIVLQLLWEIICTLEAVVKVLGSTCLTSSILSALVSIIQTLLSLIVKLPCSCVIGDLIQAVGAVLTPVVGLLTPVVGGLVVEVVNIL